MIKIIDYGLGNVRAFQNIFKRLNVPVDLARTTADLIGATKLILPGVGAFDHAMEQLQRSGMRSLLDELVLDNCIPVLGICVGMQILSDCSDEGQLAGLGWISGKVRSLRMPETPNLILPHMGWNDVTALSGNPLFQGSEADPRFYFLHSYYFDCSNSADVAAVSTYGHMFPSVVCKGSIYGVQFHPEKSHRFGINLLKNFSRI